MYQFILFPFGFFVIHSLSSLSFFGPAINACHEGKRVFVCDINAMKRKSLKA